MSDPGREALRRMLLARRDATSQDMLELASVSIRNNLRRCSIVSDAKSVGAYWSMGSEVQTHGIIQDILSAGQTLMLPAVSGRTMLFRVAKDISDTQMGSFGIPEPKKRCPVGIPEIILAPTVGATLCGTRLGYGHGYYDRYLAENLIPTVAVTLEKQIVKKIPFNPQDHSVDWIVTEKRTHQVVVI